MKKKVRVLQKREVKEIQRRKYKQEESQAMWDYLDSLKADIIKLKKENTKLKKEIKK